MWTIALDPPSADGSLDASHVYVPLQSNEVVAIDRETGAIRWRIEIESAWPVAAGGGKVFIAASDELHALDAVTGSRLWRVSLDDRAVLAPMHVRAGLLLVLVAPDELRAYRLDDGHQLWRREFGGRASDAAMAIDDERAYVVREEDQVIAVDLEDGRERWRRTLPGPLGPPASARDRVFVGAADNHLYALDADNGKPAWRKVVGGGVVGAVADTDIVYVSTLGNIIWGLKRSSGNAEWWYVPTRTAMTAPLTVPGIALHVSIGRELIALDGKTGKPVGAYPVIGELQGAPLLAPVLTPFKLGLWVLTQDGELFGLRPASVAFKELPAVPLNALPGREVIRERRPGTPRPSPPRPGAQGADTTAASPSRP